VIFTLGLGIGDDDIFDWGGIVGATIGTMITIAVAGWFLARREARQNTIAGYVPPPQ
jgi:hypothetical protein